MPITSRTRSRAALLTSGLVAGLVLTVSACSGAADKATDEPTEAAGGSQAAATDAAFTAETVDAGTFDSADLAGKPVVLWFWAPWCTVCRAEAPEVTAVAKDFAGEVTFVGVAGLGQAKDMRAFVDETGTGVFEHAIDADGSIWQQFGVVSQPAYAFISPDGSVETFTGSLPPADLQQATEELANS